MKDLSTTLEAIINTKYEKYGEVDAQALENNLKTIVSTRLEEMKIDPVNFLIGTNDDIKNALEEINSISDNDDLDKEKIRIYKFSIWNSSWNGCTKLRNTSNIC